MRRARPRARLFPYTTLFRSGGATGASGEVPDRICWIAEMGEKSLLRRAFRPLLDTVPELPISSFASLGGFVIRSRRERPLFLDRKSTRLNSSHTVISYAVFC